MLGAIIGDIVGSRFEWDNHRSKDFKLFTYDCNVTDDSIMTLAVGKAILETEKKMPGKNKDKKYSEALEELTVEYMQEIGQEYPDCGYGGRFQGWMFSNDPKPYNSYGNGAAMRVSAAGFASKTEEEAKMLSHAVTVVTHNHPEGIKGAEAATIAIFMARHGASIDAIRSRIKQDYYPLDFTIDEIRTTYKFNESCQGTVPQAIQCFLESSSFEDAIRTAISLGGDSDTIAAITGAIAEAYYGIPDDLKEQALEYLDKDMRAIFDEWVEFYRL
jgi:type I restriction enzyme M protein